MEIGLEPNGNDFSSSLEEITLTMNRQMLEGGEWGGCRAPKMDIRCILGIWMIVFHASEKRAVRSVLSPKTLRVYGYHRIATHFIFDKWIRRPQSKATPFNRDGVTERNPAEYTVGMPLTIEYGNENWAVIFSDTPVEQACGQLIFSEFMYSIAKEAIKAIKFPATASNDQSHGSGNIGYSNPEIGKLVDGLIQTGLFSVEEAYLCVINPLIEAGRFQIVDTSCITTDLVNTTLPRQNGSASTLLPEEARSSTYFLWFSYLIEAASGIHENSELWDRSMDSYARITAKRGKNIELIDSRFNQFRYERSSVSPGRFKLLNGRN